jgi:hypothetical protein
MPMERTKGVCRPLETRTMLSRMEATKGVPPFDP